VSDAVLDRHIALVESLVPGLTAAAAVALGIAAFERQRFTLRSLTGSRREQELLDRVADVEEEWWRWCSSGDGVPSVVSVEAERFADWVEGLDLLDPFRRTVLRTCVGLFSAVEAKDYWDVKYSVWRSFSAIDALEDALGEDALDGLVSSEVKRQQQELLILADGFGPGTRARLDAAIDDRRLLGEYASVVTLSPLPD
jgi:hypothetical protein